MSEVIEVGDRVRIKSDAHIDGPMQEPHLGKFGTVTYVKDDMPKTIRIEVAEVDRNHWWWSRKDLVLVPSEYCAKCDSMKYRNEMIDYLCQDCR